MFYNITIPTSYISRMKNQISHRLLIVKLGVGICGSQKIFEVSVVPSPTTFGTPRVSKVQE